MRSLVTPPTGLKAGTLPELETARISDAWVASASRLPLSIVILGTATGLFVQSVGYALGREGREGLALTLFFVGLLVMFAASSWRLLGTQAARGERITVSIVLVVGLTVSVYLVSPLLFDGYDDLLHQASLWQWGAHRGVLAHNTLLPISTRFPGLEALTLGIRWLTGVPLVVCELATVLASRIILVLAIFLVVERLTSSPRAGGAGVVVYAASPQFYGFNAAFAYQTLALALGAGCFYLLLRAVDHEQPATNEVWSKRRYVWMSIACCLATVFTHHLVGWLTVGLLVAWFLALVCLRRFGEARTVGLVTGVGLLGVGAWNVLSGPLLIRYLRPILETTVSGMAGLLVGHRRSLFQGAGTFTTPEWEQAVMLGAAVVIVVLVAVATRAVLSKKTSLRGGHLRWLPILIALGYLVVLASRLSTGSEEFGGRLSTFIFFGVAIIVGAWYAIPGRKLWRPAVYGIAGLCFLGGLLLGSGPDWLDVPGPYVAPSADQRSIDAASIAAARWAAANLPANSVVAADRDNSALMAALGHLAPESEASGGVNVGPLYFARAWGPADTALVRRGHIRYLVVDQRLASGPPAFGVYFEPGETVGRDRLTRGELAKFSSVPGMQRIYDNGPIQIYDLARMLGLSPAKTQVGAPQSWPFGPNWVLLGGAAIVVAIWIRRWWSSSAEVLLARLLAATLTVMACAVAIFFLPLPAFWLGVGFLSIFAVLGLVPKHRSTSPQPPIDLATKSDGPQPTKPRLGTSSVGLAMLFFFTVIGLLTKSGPPPLQQRNGFTAVSNGHRPATAHAHPRRGLGRYALAIALASLVIAGAAVAIAVQSETRAWQPPTTLAVHTSPSGTRVVNVHLASESAPATLQLSEDGTVVSDWHIPSGHTSWTVRLPGPVTAHKINKTELATVLLRENGHVVRTVSVWIPRG